MLYPKTNVKLMGKARHDDFNVAGYGFSAKAGINITFFKHYFIQGELKGGYINMPNIKTTFDNADSASQNFMFFQKIIAFGGIFQLYKILNFIYTIIRFNNGIFFIVSTYFIVIFPNFRRRISTTMI